MSSLLCKNHLRPAHSLQIEWNNWQKQEWWFYWLSRTGEQDWWLLLGNCDSVVERCRHSDQRIDNLEPRFPWCMSMGLGQDEIASIE